MGFRENPSVTTYPRKLAAVNSASTEEGGEQHTMGGYVPGGGMGHARGVDYAHLRPVGAEGGGGGQQGGGGPTADGPIG